MVVCRRMVYTSDRVYFSKTHDDQAVIDFVPVRMRMEERACGADSVEHQGN